MSQIAVDQISLNIESNSENAIKSLDRLIGKVNGLKSAFKALEGALGVVNKINTSFKQLDSTYTKSAVNASKVAVANDKIKMSANKLSTSMQVNADKIVVSNNKVTMSNEKMANTSAINANKMAMSNSSAFTTIERNASRLRNTLARESVGVNRASDKTTSGFLGMGKGMDLFSKMAKVAGIYTFGKMATRSLGYFINQSNAYVENLNLFTVQMGDLAEQGQRYITSMSESLGIDPNEATRYMGFFMNIATGMGVASKSAYIMSENLTSLGYDIASLVNIPIEQAMLKIQSGIAGELEPLSLVA